ncbi:MAG: HD-GYP domain-containing protein [Lautropia sp.]
MIDQMTKPGPALPQGRRYRLAVEDLRKEMFVVELDRPWLDTPFLLQGFLIDSQVELDTLGKYCEYVYVDLELSSPNVAGAIRSAELRFVDDDEPDTKPIAGALLNPAPALAARSMAAKPGSSDRNAADKDAARNKAARAAKGGPGAGETTIRAATPSGKPARRLKQRNDIAISSDTRNRFRRLVKQTANAEDPSDSLFERMFGWMLNLGGRGRSIAPARRSAAANPGDLLPAGVSATIHKERHSMSAELPRARRAFSKSESVLSEVVADIRNGKAPELQAVAGAVDSMVESMLDNPDALMWIARLKEEDIKTYNHGVKVALYLVALGRHLGFPRQELAYLGQIGMLADVGKIKVPRAILEKPGLLSPSEYGLVKEHVNLAMTVLGNGPKLPDPVLTGIAQHHERMDGSGYPKGLAGAKISIYGKMAAIADSFAALITPRAYANASAPQDALMNLYEWSGKSFHEPLVEQFVQAVGVFPVGSMVELSSGEIGVVVAHNRERRLEPKVLVLSKEDKSPLAQPVERDLYKESKKAKSERPTRIVRGLPAGAFGFKLRDYYIDEIAKQNGILT